MKSRASITTATTTYLILITLIRLVAHMHTYVLQYVCIYSLVISIGTKHKRPKVA